jgi:hypothetical protein
MAVAQSERDVVKLGRQKNFRLSEAESERLSREVKKTGLTESQWLRLLVLTALGESNLSEQLNRVAARRRSRQRARPHRE